MKKIFLIITLFINNIFALQRAEYLLKEEYVRSQKDLEVIFLDVGQGDCSFIKTPSGKTLLVDGGGSPYWLGEDVWDPGKNVIIPYLKSRNIQELDYIIISHPHGDHFGGIFAVLENIKVKTFIDNGYVEGDPNYKDLLLLVKRKVLVYEQVKEGDEIKLDKDIFIRVYFPPKRGFPFEGGNNSSIIFSLIYKNFSVLFTGDAEMDLENYLISKHKNSINSNVLKIPHHGSRTSSTVRFIKTVNPDVGIFSTGRKNRFGHPHREVVSRYSKLNVDIYNTAEEGNIVVLSDGERFTVYSNVGE